MKFTAVFVVVLISASLALAQQVKQPGAPLPGVKQHSAVAPPPINKTTSDQLAKIEQQTARVRSDKPAAHHAATTAAATPALDLGKNKPVRGARSPQPGLPQSH